MLKRFIKIYILLIIILSIILGYSIYIHYGEIKEIELIDEYINETKTTIDITKSTKSNNKTTNTTQKKTIKSNYLMILEIPKINLKKGIYDKNNKLNNVDKNVAILSSSDLPDKDKGSVIIASHNGNSKVSYFKYLEQLDINDYANIYYLGNKYIYQIYKYEIVDKVGTIQIKKDKNVSNLVLITCKNGTNDKQIVYVAKLVKITSY